LATLQLRAPDGTYAGPVVFGAQKHGRRAILGVRAGARLGRIVIRSGKGYAKVKHRLRRRWADTTRFARAKKGVPIGAGKVGQVRSRHTRNGVPGDSDLDGIPDKLDIDDDGDRILDGYDRKIHRRPSRAASQSAGSSPSNSLYFFSVQSSLSWAMPFETVNVNGGSTDQQIDFAEQEYGQLSLRGEGDFDKGTAELDCGGLVYCSTGGTGRWEPGLQRSDNVGGSPRSTAPKYPECCDADGDGRGSFVSTSYHGPPGSEHSAGFELYPGATTDQIHAGDILIDQGTIDGTLVQIPAPMGFVFSTFPALASYDDGQGDAEAFSYPRPVQCGPMGGPCISTVRSGADGHVVLALTFWRPQRRRIEGESGEGKWIDVGNLAYAIAVQLQAEHPTRGEAPLPGGYCKRDSYLAVDPSMTPLSVAPGAQTPFNPTEAVYGDRSGDRASDPANTFTDTLDLTQCLAALGTTIQSAPQLELAVWAYAVDADDGPTPSAPFAYSRTMFRYQP
jgi:hypothetical protein